MKFAVSMTAFRKMSIPESIALAKKHGIYLEFSSGIPYQKNLVELYLNADVPRMPHNYFPAPEKAFVLNLASVNPGVKERSLAHCIQGLELAAQAGASFYSVHAGFCIDPKPQDLGNAFPNTAMQSRELYWESFLDSIRQALKAADRLKVDLLIENNVVSISNLKLVDGVKVNPLLCAEAHEIESLIRDIDHPRLGILLDTGHLKVSARTLKFSSDDFIDKTYPWIRALHHSDNSGIADTNHPLGTDYWLLPKMRFFSDAFHVLEVHDQNVDEIFRQRDLLQTAISVA